VQTTDGRQAKDREIVVLLLIIIIIIILAPQY